MRFKMEDPIREYLHQKKERDLERFFWGVPILSLVVVSVVFLVGGILHRLGWI